MPKEIFSAQYDGHTLFIGLHPFMVPEPFFSITDPYTLETALRERMGATPLCEGAVRGTLDDYITLSYQAYLENHAPDRRPLSLIFFAEPDFMTQCATRNTVTTFHHGWLHYQNTLMLCRPAGLSASLGQKDVFLAARALRFSRSQNILISHIRGIRGAQRATAIRHGNFLRDAMFIHAYYHAAAVTGQVQPSSRHNLLLAAPCHAFVEHMLRTGTPDVSALPGLQEQLLLQAADCILPERTYRAGRPVPHNEMEEDIAHLRRLKDALKSPDQASCETWLGFSGPCTTAGKDYWARLVHLPPAEAHLELMALAFAVRTTLQVKERPAPSGRHLQLVVPAPQTTRKFSSAPAVAPVRRSDTKTASPRPQGLWQPTVYENTAIPPRTDAARPTGNTRLALVKAPVKPATSPEGTSGC